MDYIKVEIDEARGRRKVLTDEYVMGGPMDRPYPDYMAASHLLSDGKEGLDVLDRLKMRGEIVLPLGIRIPFAFDDMVKAEDKGMIDGPIRVLHYGEGYIEVTSYIKVNQGAYSLISYYTNHMIWPITMDMPSIPGGLMNVENFRGYLDFNKNIYGSYSFCEPNPYNKDVVFDGKMSEAEKNLDTDTNVDWIAGFGPQGALVSRLFMLPTKIYAKQVMYYYEDETAEDPPEENPGVVGIGYEMKDMNMDLQTEGGAVSYQYYYYLSELKPDEVHRILNILDHPVKTKISAVNLQDGASE